MSPVLRSRLFGEAQTSPEQLEDALRAGMATVLMRAEPGKESFWFRHLTSELSGAALAASGGGPKGRNVLERFVMYCPVKVHACIILRTTTHTGGNLKKGAILWPTL